MGVIQDSVTNLIGGVSQQTDKLMFPNQVKEMKNYYPQPIDGVSKRPPLELISELFTNSESFNEFYFHSVFKDNEEYYVILDGSTIKVFDFTGISKTVNFENNTTNYITTNTPQKDLTAVTIGEYTFIVNKTKQVALKNDTYPNPYKNAALIFVRQGDYSTDHKITVNGTEVASYSTTSDVSTTKTNKIADELYNDLVTALGTTNWTIEKNGSCILLQKVDKTAFTVSTTDSNANRNLYAFYETSESLNVLPLVAPDGFILKIVGENVNKEDDYYVEFQTTDNSTFGNGTWIECPAPDIQYKFNNSTMPHALVRNANGTFTFQEIEWSDRAAGDEYSAPTPSFVGNTIKEMFSYKGRLGLLSGDKSYYSDVEDIYSWFKRTTLTELDTDPIEVASNHQMVDLYHSLPFNESLYLFSAKSIFNLKSGDVFSNRTVTLDLSKEYQCSKDCKPIVSGSTGMFLFENGEHTRVFELYLSDYIVNVREVTDAVPQFLNKNIHKIVVNNANNTLLFLSNDNKKDISMYSYYYNGTQKVQSSWYNWTFKNNILDVTANNQFLYFIWEDSETNKIYLSKMDLSAKQNDFDLDFKILLDNRYQPTITDNEDGTLTLNKKYTGEVIILDKNGNEVEIDSQDTTTYTVTSDSTDFYIGQNYVANMKLGKIYVRQTTQTGQTRVRNGILMLKELDLNYSNSGYFKVTVTPKYTTCIASTFVFSGMLLGTTSTTFGVIPISDGIFKVPLISRNEDIDINIINDSYLPSTFISYDWIGDFTARV